MVKKGRQPRGSRALIAATSDEYEDLKYPPRGLPLLLHGTVTYTGLL